MSLIGGIVLVVLAALGFRHARRARSGVEHPAELGRRAGQVESKAA